MITTTYIFMEKNKTKYIIYDHLRLFTFVFRFLFSIGLDGLVTMVYHQNEDEHEVLSLKKVLASTLSAKVTVST